jgi:hypothetical protein
MGHEHLAATEEPAQKRGTSLFSPSPLQMCREREKQARNLAILGGGGDFDNDEIRLTSANQFKIGWDSGDLETRAGGPRVNVASSGGQMEAPEDGRLPASCFCSRTELL